MTSDRSVGIVQVNVNVATARWNQNRKEWKKNLYEYVNCVIRYSSAFWCGKIHSPAIWIYLFTNSIQAIVNANFPFIEENRINWYFSSEYFLCQFLSFLWFSSHSRLNDMVTAADAATATAITIRVKIYLQKIWVERRIRMCVLLCCLTKNIG